MVQVFSYQTRSHSKLMDLLDDTHPQYLDINGRTGGQVANGGINAGELLQLLGNPVDGGIVQVDSPAKFKVQATVGNIIGGSAGVVGGIGLDLQSPSNYIPTISYSALRASFSAVLGAISLTHRAINGIGTLSSNGFTLGNIVGLDYLVNAKGSGGGSLVDAIAIRGRFGTISVAPTLTRFAAIVAMTPTPLLAPVYTKAYGVHIEDQSAAMLGIGPHSLHIDDQVFNPNGSLIHAGGITPNEQLLPGAPANLGVITDAQSQHNLAFNENGIVTLRNTRWRTSATLLPTDKVLIGV
jgi:hypothetical protein